MQDTNGEKLIEDLWNENGVSTGKTAGELVEEGKLKIGQYVNYPVKYSNVPTWYSNDSEGTGENYTSEEKYANKWRIIAIDEETNEVKLISAGVPLNYYHYNDARKSVENLTTKFFETEITSNTKPEQYQFFKNGFKDSDGNDVIKIDEVKKIFDNKYTKKEVNGMSEVRSITREDFDEVANILLEEKDNNNPRTTYHDQYNKYYEKNKDLYDLLIVPAKNEENDESGSYSNTWFASTYGNNIDLWCVYYYGDVRRDVGNRYVYGVRPIVSLVSDVKFTQASDNTNDVTTWDLSR